VQLLRTLGASVYVLGTTRRRGDYPGTMQTPGVPDLLAFVPTAPGASERRLLCIEVKTTVGRLSPAQVVFRSQCAAADIAHVTGPLDAVIAWLLERRLLSRGSVPHYRLPP
jgi:hypothetical protein